MIYLASASPRRHELLLQIGIPHEVLKVPAPAGADEPRLPDESPEAYVRRTAKDKASRAVEFISRQGHPALPVLSADTTVILGRDILGKPTDCADAHAMLRRLSGRAHQVHSAVVLAWEGRYHEAISITTVSMRRLSDAEIDRYCASGEPMGKAGAYGIQGIASIFIRHISGSYSGVMGLPLFETHQLLLRAGLRRF